MTTGVTADFDAKYRWIVETYVMPSKAYELDMRKRKLKADGFIVRTKWFSSLSAYGLRAIKPRINLDDDVNGDDEMMEWVRF
jgi:hypothetical protein